jgi:hypothetical protein
MEIDMFVKQYINETKMIRDGLPDGPVLSGKENQRPVEDVNALEVDCFGRKS